MTKTRITVLALAAVALTALVYLQPLRFVNNLFYDLNFRFASAQPSDSVVVAAIDERSIGKIGAMPWPRSTLARLMDRVSACAPKAVAVDILFPKREAREADDSLAAAFSRVPTLVLPFKAGRIMEKIGAQDHAVPTDIFNFRFIKIDNQDKLGATSFYTAAEILPADTVFTRNAKYGGFLNVSTSTTSQKLREAVQVIQVGGEYFPSLALASVAAFHGLTASQFALDGKGAVVLGTQRVPLTSYAATTFIHFRKNGISLVSASDLLDGTADAAMLKGKLVFVGVTDPGSGADFFTTPIGPQFPGVCVWATTALDILQNRWISNVGWGLSLVNWLLLLLIFPGCILIFPLSKRVVTIAGSTALMIVSIFVSAALFHSSHFFFDPTGQLYAWFFVLLWLAAQKAVPSLAQSLSITLEPPDSTDDTVPPPPAETDFHNELPHTDTAAFVIKTITSAAERAPKPGPKATLSGTIIEDDAAAIASGEKKIRRSQPSDFLLNGAYEIAGGRILRSLGSGGMADVYLTWNPRLEIYRAVKVIKPGQPENILSRFETEIRIFSKLDHPNIVNCYSVGDWHTLPYLEMEYINGASMEEVLNKCKFLSVEQSLAIGILVCRALHYAHNQTITIYGKEYKGVVHRDLKPANIMLCRAGKVKLTDFGIARPGAVSLHTMDAPNAVIGTLPYLAPEQIGSGELTARADIYALGVTLYELLTGEKAFPQTEIAPILNAKMNGTFNRIAPSSRISKEIVAATEKAMSTRPDDRFANAKAFGEELERLFVAHFSTDGFSPIRQLVKRVWS